MATGGSSENYCDICDKQFHHRCYYTNHLKGKYHQQQTNKKSLNMPIINLDVPNKKRMMDDDGSKKMTYKACICEPLPFKLTAQQLPIPFNTVSIYLCKLCTEVTSKRMALITPEGKTFMQLVLCENCILLNRKIHDVFGDLCLVPESTIKPFTQMGAAVDDIPPPPPPWQCNTPFQYCRHYS